MSTIRIAGFGGMVPVLDDRLLPENAAVLSENCLLESGSIVPLPKPSVVHSIAAGIQKSYRIPNSYIDTDFLFDSIWMDFADIDTTILRAPIFDDTFDRFYWCAPSIAPRYNTRARIAAGSPAWLLGVPTPITIIAVVPSGGVSTTLVTRSYLYTYVTAYGEESAPSPPVTLTNKIDATWAVTVTSPPAGDLGVDRNITKVRIYRTVVSALGEASYYFVTELTLPTVTYNDALTDVTVSANSQLESITWTPPPSNLQGMVLMPNGIIAGWRGSPQNGEVWFSEPYRPHAWPAKYVLTIEYPIVGMGVTNQTLVVATASYPTTFQGVHPSSMTGSKLMTFEPCSSNGSIISTPEGVYYASPNGLVLVQPGEAVNITKDFISKRNWQRLTNVARLRAARLGMAYFAYGSIKAGVFQVDAFQNDAFAVVDYTGAYTGVVIDPTSERVSFSMLRSIDPIINCYNDVWSGQVFVISNSAVNWIDVVGDVLPQSGVWKSKIFQTPQLQNFVAMKIYFDQGNALGGGTAGIEFYADDVLLWTRPLAKSGELMRLPSGYKASFCQFIITTTLRIHSVQLATAVKELAHV